MIKYLLTLLTPFLKDLVHFELNILQKETRLGKLDYLQLYQKSSQRKFNLLLDININEIIVAEKSKNQWGVLCPESGMCEILDNTLRNDNYLLMNYQYQISSCLFDLMPSYSNVKYNIRLM